MKVFFINPIGNAPITYSSSTVRSHSMLSHFMLSSFLFLIFHVKKKLYHTISVLPKIDVCGLGFGFVVFICLFSELVLFAEGACILQD